MGSIPACSSNTHRISQSSPSNTRTQISALANKFGVRATPGHPLLPVDNRQRVLDFLARDILHDKLNKLSPVFWLLATPYSSHISALHHQIVRGRNIVITENPGLHLLWHYDKVYIKPLPPYLTNYAFWKLYLSGDTPASSALRQAALGYMRSYHYLIQHRSDFDVAVEKKLVDATTDFAELLYFLQPLQDISDDEVTPRFRYGELRLDRLNLYSKFYLFEVHYHKVMGHYGPYLAEIVAPFLFVFAAVSVALGAMQVVLAVEQMRGIEGWKAFSSASRGFSVACLFLVLIAFSFVPGVVFFFLLRELVFALKHYRRT